MTDAELATLSILAEGPLVGHEIQQEIARRGLRAWTDIGTASLYYVLEKLERQGLAESEGARAAGASRRRYRITPAGEGVLQTAVVELLSTPREANSGFELGLANVNVLRPEQIRAAFTGYRQELAVRLAHTRERRQQIRQGGAGFHVEAIFSHRIAMLAAELAWVEGFIERWELQAPPDEPEPGPPPDLDEVAPMERLMLPRDPGSLHRTSTDPGRKRSGSTGAPPAPDRADDGETRGRSD